MAVEQVGEKYKCNICGNELTVTKAGGGTLVCCGEDMEKLEQLSVRLQEPEDYLLTFSPNTFP